MTDQQIAALIDNLRRFEGFCNWMYLDTANPPRVTVGIGVMLPTSNAALALPFENAATGQRATEDEIVRAYTHVKAMPGGKGISFYKMEPPIELPAEEVTALAVQRLKDVFLPGLRATFLMSEPDGEGWDTLPWPAQQVLVDLAWNLGLSGLAKFRSLLAAVDRRDWERAALESHVSTSRPARNEWRAATFRQCMAGSVAA